MLEKGMKAEMTKTVTDEDVRMFAKVSSDTNPVHLDEEYAKKSMFGRRIAHGMISAGYISAVLGNKLPGNGSIYLGQTLKFMKPVYLNDTITTVVEIIDVNEERHIYTLKTDCINQRGEVVTTGEAKIMKK
ncbi:MAG: MaoC family dehydratase [Bacilli bacterium]|nr:MaoC family dehydratase [Bacilli bacterium]MDD3422129.1 MaoC family dehydratase [Bacilli bacterium]MDD4065429.1 MaoC family dehydratase [Bacilli bacterium]